MESRNKHPRLFTYWLSLVALAIFAPRAFPPPPDVDLAPAAGLTFLIFALGALAVAGYTFAYTLRHRREISSRKMAMGLSPLILTTAFFTWLLFWIAI